MFTRRQVLTFVGLAVAAVGVRACSGDGGSRGATLLRGTTSLLQLPFDETSGVAQAARGSADLGWNLLLQGTEPNRAIAPSSLAVTLGMLAEGATDETLASLDAVFGLTGDERSAALGALRQSLRPYELLPESVDVNDPPEAPLVHQASQAVVVEGKEVEQQFLDRIGAYFDVGTQQVALGEMKAVLDDWVVKNTAGLIEKSAIEVRPDLVLVLQDAILFAAAWATAFPYDDTPLEFEGPGGTQQVKAISGEFSVPFAVGEGWKAVRLPYDEALAMDVIVPDAGPEALSAQQLDEVRVALDDATAVTVAVTMPPSDLTGGLNLLPLLGAEGVTFEGSVDGIFPGAIVDQFAQQVRLMVSAKGTVGAAVTEVAGVESAPQSPENELVADRPFVMRVLDTRTGWPLFLAIVSDAADAAPEG